MVKTERIPKKSKSPPEPDIEAGFLYVLCPDTHIGIHTPRGSWPEAKVPLLEIWSEWRYATAFATATATISEWWWWNRAPQKPLLHPRISNPGALQKLNNIFPGNWGGTSTASHGPEFGLGLGIGMLRWSAPVQKCACV